jgi:hypothetical protein
VGFAPGMGSIQVPTLISQCSFSWRGALVSRWLRYRRIVGGVTGARRHLVEAERGVLDGLGNLIYEGVQRGMALGKGMKVSHRVDHVVEANDVRVESGACVGVGSRGGVEDVCRAGMLPSAVDHVRV